MRIGWLVGSVSAAGLAAGLAQWSAGGGGPAGQIGPDVLYHDISSTVYWGSLGGIAGYSLATSTCNIGDENLLWGTLSNGTPVVGFNAYRLYGGRLEQIGMSFAKSGTVAGATTGCGLPCNGQGGSVLGVGCRDVYSAGFNGIQSILKRRSDVNAFTGVMAPIPGGSGDAIFRRLQIPEIDLSSAAFPGALYFVEGVYVGSDDAPAGNALNNASHKRITVGAGLSLDVAGPIQQGIPALYAWRDHGNGLNVPDDSVVIVNADVPLEGRFVAAGRASDNGDGTWRYEYAVFNLNSDRASGSVTVSIPGGTVVGNAGFRDVSYHSGEVYDNTDWSTTAGAQSVTWESPATFAQDPDTNALRWGTTYNFWFDADRAPGEGVVRIGLFKPGTPTAVSAVLPVPVAPCPGNCGILADAIVDIGDLLDLLAQWGGPGTCDFDGGGVGVTDLLILLAAWGTCS